MTSLIVSESCTRANKRARGSAFPSLGRSGGLQLEACWDTLLRAWLLDFASVRPMVTRQSELHRVLGLLANDLPKPEWVALVDQNGLIVACVPPEPPVETERISAMTAASVAMGDRVLREIEGGGRPPSRGGELAGAGEPRAKPKTRMPLGSEIGKDRRAGLIR